MLYVLLETIMMKDVEKRKNENVVREIPFEGKKLIIDIIFNRFPYRKEKWTKKVGIKSKN